MVALVAASVACGSSSSSSGNLSSNDVAVVDGTHITKSQLDHQIAILLAVMKQQHQQVPKAGSADYKSQVIDRSVQTLVLSAQVRKIAQQLGVSVSDAKVNSDIQKAIQSAYNGDRQKYLNAIKKIGVTEQDVFEQFQTQALETAIGQKLAGESPVNDKAAQDYYNAHKSSFQVTDDTRKVDYILVPDKATAQADLQKLASGKSEADVAKGAIDSNSLHSPVQPFTVTRNSGDEKNFVDAAMTLPTNKWGAPVPVSKSYADSQLKGQCKPTCYFLIKPVDDLVKKGTQQSYSDVKSQIIAQLKQQVQSTHVADRERSLLAAIKKKTQYATSYAPPAASTAPTTTTPSTT
ncbi:MAG: SurA N-terminal domain-containing protein [Gaiellales bacterium]